jgi:hypothetical protein
MDFECIRSISSELEVAVDTCIDAAGFEFDSELQKTLLRAATFGKCFLDRYNSEKFVSMCRILRVLNAIRRPEIGIPLTYGQYVQSSEEVIVSRLLSRNLHVLALRISKYLSLDFHGVLIHWACHKIKVSNEDVTTLSRTIIEKFREYEHDFFSFTEVAQAAYESGRRNLAIKVILK